MLRAVIYCRCSTEEESQKNALRQQVTESRQSAQANGWLIVDEYIEAKSGTTTAKRNEYSRLYEDLDKDKFDIVLIKTQDRLMRNTKDWYLFIDRLVTSGKKLYMYLEDKYYSADDALITGIKAILAEEYSKELSKKINNAHYHRQQEGESLILPPQTYGLQKNKDGTISLVEAEVKVIRLMFLLCETMGCNSIAHYLQMNGLTDRWGKPFQAEAIRRIIRNPIRCGTVIQNKLHYDFLLKKTIRVPEEQWVIHKNAVPAIVTDEEWKKANEAMDCRAVKANGSEKLQRGTNRGKHPFSGKIFCGLCGSPFYRTTRRISKTGRLVIEWKCQKYIQYGRKNSGRVLDQQCKSESISNTGCDNVKLAEENLCGLLECVVKKHSLSTFFDYSRMKGDIIALLVKTLKHDEKDPEPGQIQSELKRLEIQQAKLMDKLLDGVISDMDYKKKMNEIRMKTKELSDKLNAISGENTCYKTMESRLQLIQKRLEEGMLKQAAIAVWMETVTKIAVYPDKLQIIFETEYEGEKKTEKIYEVPFTEYFFCLGKKEREYQAIMKYMKENPKITARQIAESEHISLSAANARIRKLKQTGCIYFDGKGGHGCWVVKEKNEGRQSTKDCDTKPNEVYFKQQR